MSISLTNKIYLDDTNWADWRVYIVGRLAGVGALPFWNLATTRTPPTHRAMHTLDEKELKGISVVFDALSPGQFRYVDGHGTLQAIHRALADHHEPVTALAKTLLVKEYGRLEWHPTQESMSNYLERFKSLVRRLEAVGRIESREDLTVKLLSSIDWDLRLSVQPFIDATTSMAALYLLLEEHYTMAVERGKLRRPSATHNHERALMGSAKPPRGGGRDRRNDNCHSCGKRGHWSPDCPTRDKAKVKPTKGQRRFQPKQFDDSGNFARLDEYLLTALDWTSLANAATSSSSPKRQMEDTVVLDTGATAYMTGNAQNLFDLVKCQRAVKVADGSVVQVTQMGKMRLLNHKSKSVVLNDVLLVTGLPTTLFSLSIIMHKYGSAARLMMSGDLCTVEIHGEDVLTGRQSKGSRLYELDVSIVRDTANLAVPSATQADLWHRRLGHVHVAVLEKCAKMNLGVPKGLKPMACVCSDCIEYKMHRTPAPKKSSRILKPGECWASDTKGPVRVKSLGGHKFYRVYVCVATGYKRVFFVHSTDSDTQLHDVQNLLQWSEVQTGNKCKVFWSDNGPEYGSDELTSWLEAKGISHDRSTPGEQWQNGVAERSHRTLVEMALTMLSTAGLPSFWWAEALNTAAMIQNRLPNHARDDKVPAQAFLSHPPSLANMRTFGCKAWTLIRNPDKRNKLEPKGHACIFIGYAENMKAYKLWNLVDKKVMLSAHVKFAEHEFYSQKSVLDTTVAIADSDDDYCELFGESEKVAAPSNDASSDSVDANSRDRTPLLRNTATSSAAPRYIRPTTSSVAPKSTHPDVSVPTFSAKPQLARPASAPRLRLDRQLSGIPQPSPTQSPLATPRRGQADARPTTPTTTQVSRRLGFDFGSEPRRSGRTSRPPSRAEVEGYDFGQPERGFRAVDGDGDAIMTVAGIDYSFVTIPLSDVPRNHKEAMASPEWSQWEEAEKLELSQLQENGTFTSVKTHPGMWTLPLLWVYNKKRDATGKVVKYKARLVVGGNRQVAGRDYNEKSAPVIRASTLRVALAIGAKLDYCLEQGDAKNAYTQAKIDREVFVTHPPGYGTKDDTCLQVLMALYGMVQSGYLFFEHNAAQLKKLGFEPSQADPCLYLRKHPVNGIEFVCVYVDDYVVGAKTKGQVDDIFNSLGKLVKLERQGDIHFILGIRITRDRRTKTLSMSQGAAVKDLLTRFGMWPCNTKAVAEVDDKDGLWEDDSEPLADQATYRSIVGSLVYLMTCTRPDLAHSVQRLSRYLQAPRRPHMEGAKRILRYLMGTVNIGICFGGGSSDLTGYSDASWAPRPDRMSTSGYICVLNNGPVSWKSARQRVTALSSCESEYIAMFDATRELVWLRRLLHDLGFTQGTTTLLCDNQSAIAVGSSKDVSERTKHIEVRYHFVREIVAAKQVCPTYVPTSDQLADVLTKVSTQAAVDKFKGQLMVTIKNEIQAPCKSQGA